MNCFQCKAKLGEKEICPKCGADNTMYRKIIHTSNHYYNVGLMKAKARNLSGAVESLRFCLQMNKENIQARNLLGLVHYEMGDADLAICEWSISKTIMPNNNPAENYIQEITNDSDRVNTYNNVVRVFNQSLECIKTGAEDIAIAKLKKVISLNPGFLKAYQLIALLYVKRDEYEKAEAILNRCLEADQGNIVALTYLNELNRAKKQKNKKVGVAGRQENLNTSRNRSIFSFIDFGSYVMSVLCIIMGFVLGWSVFNYVKKPELEYQMQQKQEIELQEYQTIITDLSGIIDDKDDTIEDLEDEINRLQQEHNEIIDAQKTGDIEKLIENGLRLYTWKEYEKALRNFEAASVIKLDDVRPIFWMAECYRMLEEKEQAIEQYRILLTNYPNSEYVEQGATILAELLEISKEEILEQYKKQE